MRIFTKLLSICAGGLFVASLVLAFLGADSVERPATMPLLCTSMVCLIASDAVVLVLVAIVISQRRRTDARVHRTA
jgi:hypothetical protein